MTDKPLKVNQANAFYNYCLGFDSAKIDLLKTGSNFLKARVSTSVFFSDCKYMYLDKSGNRKVEMITVTPKGSNLDSNREVKFTDETPTNIASELRQSCHIAFNENRIMNEDVAYIRVFLPPTFLEHDEYKLPILASVKIYSDGIAILSFQLDRTWEGLDEGHFLTGIVNLSEYYFKSIWVDSNLQNLDAKVLLDKLGEDKFSIDGNYLTSRKVKQFKKNRKREIQKNLDEALQLKGCVFNFGEASWRLHQIVGTENNESAELTVNLCREIYCNAISSLLVSEKNERKTSLGHFMWKCRPSITLLRFEDQPETKEELYKNFSHSISIVLLRADNRVKNFDLPTDLRAFNDFCLHGNRSILLWQGNRIKNGLTQIP
jgi:hypothetical protein